MREFSTSIYRTADATDLEIYRDINTSNRVDRINRYNIIT